MFIVDVEFGRQEGRERDASEGEGVPLRCFDPGRVEAWKHGGWIREDGGAADELDVCVDAEELRESFELRLDRLE